MQKQVDLFGFDTVGLSFNEQQEVRAVTRKPSVTVVIADFGERDRAFR
ncbi:hypothetical protein [Pseudomonas saponiphila]|nr:hypothetical protein [Pseudomonas saponiphila]